MNLFIIDDEPASAALAFPPGVSRGLVPRDWKTHPAETFAPLTDLELIPRSEWSDRIKEKAAQKSRLSDLRNFAALNQNPQPYCWAYSTTTAVMLLRAVNNQPPVRLSAHAIGCKVMSFQERGGWCGLSAKFHREQGCPSVELWTERSMNRNNDRAETWANASLHKVTEDWADLTRQVYDQNMTFDQVATCLLSNIPVAVDMTWWAHSICAMDLVEVEPGSFGLLILNSWGDEWGERGTAILRGSKAIPDGAVALRVTGASEK